MNERNGNAGHPIRVVAQRTGLTPAALRAWERRYGVVGPSRSEGGQRLYSDEDVARLRLLVQAVDGGRRISQVASLDKDQLERLIQEDRDARVPEATGPRLPRSGQVAHALRLVEEMNTPELERFLKRVAISLTPIEVVSGILVPLLSEVGAGWTAGRFGPSTEHVASVTIRRYLEWLTDAVEVAGGAPLALTSTPAGQRHEFGALLAGVVAAGEGWRVKFLGPDLPIEEIKRASDTLGADLVVMSAVFPELPIDVCDEIVGMKRALQDRVDVVIGGGAAAPHRALWAGSGVLFFDTLDQYRMGLGELYGRRYGPPTPSLSGAR